MLFSEVVFEKVICGYYCEVEETPAADFVLYADGHCQGRLWEEADNDYTEQIEEILS